MKSQEHVVLNTASQELQAKCKPEIKLALSASNYFPNLATKAGHNMKRTGIKTIYTESFTNFMARMQSEQHNDCAALVDSDGT